MRAIYVIKIIPVATILKSTDTSEIHFGDVKFNPCIIDIIFACHQYKNINDVTDNFLLKLNLKIQGVYYIYRIY